MDQLTTQCPNCGTSFRVTQEQLLVANGSVRCGSCMHIFQASSHRTDQTEQAGDPALDFSQKDLGNTPDDNDNDNDLSGTSEFSDSFLEMDKWADDESSAFQEMESNDSEKKSTDEQWARDLLDNLDSEPATAPSVDKANADANTAKQTSPQSEPQEDQQPVKSDSFSALDGDNELAEAFAVNNEEDELEDDDKLPPNDSVAVDFKDQLLTQIEPAPVELHLDTSSRLLKNSLWSVSILSAFSLLFVQALYFNFPTLSAHPDYRPWYARICNTLDCELPKLEDFNLIKASNLMIRTHPEQNDALIVDAIITNRANYKQPFPRMELVFTDLQGKIIAGRIFEPDEYLKGELRDTSSMPYQRPIHLSLELVDPGPQATSYSIQLHEKKAS